MGAAGECEMRDRSDTCQSFPAKSQARDALEVFQAGNLAGRMACQRECEVVARNACPIVADLDLLDAARLQLDLQARCAGIEAVFQQLFECGRRAVDDFPRGDLIDEQVRQTLNGHGGKNYRRPRRLRLAHAALLAYNPPLLRERSPLPDNKMIAIRVSAVRHCRFRGDLPRANW